LKHLDDLREGYFKHGLIALSYSLKLMFYSFVIFIHAIVPSIFTATGSDGIKLLIDRMDKRKSSIDG